MPSFPRRADHSTARSYQRAIETYRELQAGQAEERAQPFGPAELRRVRERLGLTQLGLAAQLGIATNTVARWERGEREIPPYLRLALERIEAGA